MVQISLDFLYKFAKKPAEGSTSSRHISTSAWSWVTNESILETLKLGLGHMTKLRNIFWGWTPLLNSQRLRRGCHSEMLRSSVFDFFYMGKAAEIVCSVWHFILKLKSRIKWSRFLIFFLDLWLFYKKKMNKQQILTPINGHQMPQIKNMSWFQISNTIHTKLFWHFMVIFQWKMGFHQKLSHQMIKGKNQNGIWNLA